MSDRERTAQAESSRETADGPGPSAAPVIRLVEVDKTFDRRSVLEKITLSVSAGRIFRMIGPSGCGKSTVVRLMVGLVAPTSGSVTVFGDSPTAFTASDRQHIGYMPQAFALYPTLSVSQNMRFVAGLYGVGWLRRRRRIRSLLEAFELSEARHRLARDLSGGMQRRLSLAAALSHEPALLFVDEPTAGLDPMLRARIWEHLRGLRSQRVTIVLTTQLITEAEACDSLAVLREGRLFALGTPAELRQQVSQEQAVEVEAGRAATRRFEYSRRHGSRPAHHGHRIPPCAGRSGA